MNPIVKAFFDETTNTASYVVREPDGSHCAIVDSVLDYDPSSGRTSTNSADEIVSYVRENDLQVDWLLETHAHADHLSAAPYLKRQLGGKTGIGEHICEVQKTFSQLFNLESDFVADGSQFDHLFGDAETFAIGDLSVITMHTPGHTPACISYVSGDTAFIGDTLFMPDYGTARADFPGGDARVMYQSIQKLLTLPDHTRLFLCHDYKATGREEYQWQTTVEQQRHNNIHIGKNSTVEDFISMRTNRDSTLSMPTLLLPAVQVNIRAGELPPAESNGVTYLKIPVNQL